MSSVKSRSWLGNLVLEVASIVFAVLLALGANAWYQSVQEERLVRSVLADIQVELVQNAEALATALAYHQMLADTLQQVYQQDAMASFDLRGVWRGAQAPLLQRAAYETAVVTQAFALMEFDVSSRLAAIYQQQQNLDRLFIRYLEAFLAADMRDTERITQMVTMMVGDVWYEEQALQEAYAAVMAFLAEQVE